MPADCAKERPAVAKASHEPDLVDRKVRFAKKAHCPFKLPSAYRQRYRRTQNLIADTPKAAIPDTEKPRQLRGAGRRLLTMAELKIGGDSELQLLFCITHESD
jgi:hypothetical protein